MSGLTAAGGGGQVGQGRVQVPPLVLRPRQTLLLDGDQVLLDL